MLNARLLKEGLACPEKISRSGNNSNLLGVCCVADENTKRETGAAAQVANIAAAKVRATRAPASCPVEGEGGRNGPSEGATITYFFGTWDSDKRTCFQFPARERETERERERQDGWREEHGSRASQTDRQRVRERERDHFDLSVTLDGRPGEGEREGGSAERGEREAVRL